MPRYRVELTRTEYGTSSACVEVDAIDVRHAKAKACEEADFDGSVDWYDSGDVGVQDVEEIEPEEDEEEDGDEEEEETVESEA